MFHLALYTKAIASATANQQLTALADPAIAPAASGLLMPQGMSKLVRAAGVGGLLNRAQLSSASMRDYAPFDIDPVAVGTVIGSPAAYLDLADSPIPLSPNEELDAFVTNSAATSTQTTVAVWFADGPLQRVRGRVFSMHWTATATLVVNVFTAFTMTLDNGLPSGTFAIVGSRCLTAGGLFHRFVPRGGAAWRPGSFCVQTNAAVLDAHDRYGEMGEWMRFTNTTPPQIEVFSLSADTAEEGILDLVQVA